MTNSVSGALGGFAVAKYTVAGGPYTNAVKAITGKAPTAIMRVYAYIDTGSGDRIRTLIYEKILVNNKPFRLPGGYLADNWEVEFSGTDTIIHEAILGTTMRELTRR